MSKRKSKGSYSELCRGGNMPVGSPELHKGGSPPDNPELFRRGTIAPTMPELGGMFRPQTFVDRIRQNEQAKEDYTDRDLIPGHKVMSGMEE